MLMLQTNMVNWWEQMMPAGTTDKPSEEWPVLSYKWTAEQIAWERGKNVAGCLPWNKVDTVERSSIGMMRNYLLCDSKWQWKFFQTPLYRSSECDYPTVDVVTVLLMDFWYITDGCMNDVDYF